MKILVTGAKGFIGSQLIQYLEKLTDCSVVGMVRSKQDVYKSSSFELRLGEIGSSIRQNFNLSDIDVIIHTAGRAHIMNDTSLKPIEEFRRVNTFGTLCLARLAAKSGVKRFVFLSSIKVNGELTRPGQYFKPDDVCIPNDPYSLSKYEAEQGLLILAKQMGMEVVIIRPPLVYGRGVKGNFLSLIKWVGRPVPLPFGAIDNKRSLIALDNLVSFINLCANPKKSPKAANQIFLISDGKDVSTTQLLIKVRQAFHFQSPLRIKSLLVPIPVFFMLFFAKLLGKSKVANRLFGSLQVDSSKAQNLLGWKPVVTMDEQLAKMAEEI
ncbi:SDR family oxidoreductase [Alphaproteobacteria bacterium]|nr:SDR family oxidoreductase [Alphaproteobacteria bacterium]